MWQEHCWYCGSWLRKPGGRGNVGLNWSSCSERLSGKKASNKQVIKELIKFRPMQMVLISIFRNNLVKPCSLFINMLICFQYRWFCFFPKLFCESNILKQFPNSIDIESQQKSQQNKHNLFCLKSLAAFRKSIS